MLYFYKYIFKKTDLVYNSSINLILSIETDFYWGTVYVKLFTEPLSVSGILKKTTISKKSYLRNQWIIFNSAIRFEKVILEAFQ